MDIEVERRQAKQRAIIEGVAGRQVVWLQGDRINSTEVFAPVFEIPRCKPQDVRHLGENATEVATAIASSITGAEIDQVHAVRWDSGEIGVALVLKS